MYIYTRKTDEGFVFAEDARTRLFVQIFGIGRKGAVLRVYRINDQIIDNAEVSKSEPHQLLFDCDYPRAEIGKKVQVSNGAQLTVLSVNPIPADGSVDVQISTTFMFWLREDWWKDEAEKWLRDRLTVQR